MSQPRTIQGRVWKYGDNINTDVIFPGKYTYTVTDPQEMAGHALEDLDPEFSKKVQPGDVIVAGSNFGCGSSREQAAFCLTANKVGAVVAGSFSRIFFRNAINAGLPTIELPEVVGRIEPGEQVTLDLGAGTLRCRAGVYRFPALPPEVIGIVEAGGLVPYTRQRLGTEGEIPPAPPQPVVPMPAVEPTPPRPVVAPAAPAAKPKPKPKAAAKPKPKPAVKPKPKPAAKPKGKAKGKPVAKPKAKAKPKAVPKKKAKPKRAARPRAKAGGKRKVARKAKPKAAPKRKAKTSKAKPKARRPR